MRLMNWNIEHQNSWWTSDEPPVLRDTFAGTRISPRIGDVAALAARAANVIRAVDPDVVTIQESAGLAELDMFFNDMVETDGGVGRPWQIIRGAGGAQSLAVAARITQDSAVASITAGPDIVAGVDLTRHYLADTEPEDDPNLDPQLDDVFFARKPQPVVINAHGADLLILNNHLKSKFVNNGRNRWEAGGEEQLEFIREALIARRRISAEAFRIRSYLDALMQAQPDIAIVVTGDLNDGPGADFFEQHYLTHSVVDRVFGSVFYPERRLTHVLFDHEQTDHTAEFFDFVVGHQRTLVLDHVGYSAFLRTHWATDEHRVEIDVYNDNSDPAAPFERDQLPSDHRPVIWRATPNQNAPQPAAIPTGWDLPANGALHQWQRTAITKPIAAAFIPNAVKTALAERTIEEMQVPPGVSSALHRVALEAGIRTVLYQLTPTSTPADLDAAIAAACATAPTFPFCP